MKVAFTGTRKGMNVVQKKLFEHAMSRPEITDFYHGDCIGADEDAHNVIVQIDDKEINIKKRPCDLESQRAFTKEGEVIAEPEAPLDRNKKLVDDCDILVAAPGEEFEELRSGTWSTIRYAKKSNKPVIIIWPNGHLLK